VEIREQQVVGPQHLHLLRLGLLHAEDQLGLLEHGLRVREDPRALGQVLVVRDGAADARAGLDHRFMAVLNQFPHTGRREGHAVLVRLDLRRNPDLHSLWILPLKSSLLRAQAATSRTT
jgi:hypothetical protein